MKTGRANFVSILTGTTKSQFSRIHNSMLRLLWKCLLACLLTKFEENHVNHFQDMSEQTSCFFSLHKRKIAITHKRIHCNSRLCTLTGHILYKGDNHYHYWCKSVQQCQSYSWLFMQNKIDMLTSLQGKPLAWTTWKSSYTASVGRFNIGKVLLVVINVLNKGQQRYLGKNGTIDFQERVFASIRQTAKRNCLKINVKGC